MAESKFAQFITAKKIDPRRILSASRNLEKFRPEDRAIKLKKRQGKVEGADAAAPKETRKSRSGRPVTDRTLTAAIKGAKLSGPAKTRLLRAVNHLLEQKKQGQVELKVLF